MALTIDDGPTPEATPAVLDLLALHGAKATFFLTGWRAEQHPELVADIVAGGHWVYAHCWDHVRLDRVPPQRLITDMQRCETLLAQHRPTPSPYLVRLPQNGGYRNARVHRALARWQPGCQFVHWGASTEDHLISPRCAGPDDVEKECSREVDRLLASSALDGSILLMHDQPLNQRPGAQFKAAVTVTLARLLLERLGEAGFVFHPVQPRQTQPWWTRVALV